MATAPSTTDATVFEDTKSRAAIADVAPGTRIGRYIVLGTLGRGGMGLVLLAQDTELERKVAIKLVHHRARSVHDATSARSRLLREAQAMARLSHPNVITVHDVGTFDDRVFVAMEYVEGTTLRIWLDEAPRTLDEILRVFAAAARGLAAAHRAGLVHRDFKPDNVMVADDPRGARAIGRVLVLDFGLARSEHGSQSESQPASRSMVSMEGSGASLTLPGWVMGTPGYMAPEQHRGRATAASDQYAFCVALYAAVCGERPFEGRDLEELARQKERGRLRPFPSHVPTAVRAALTRGLAPDPAARFATMDELVEALIERPRRRRARARTTIAAVATGVLLFGAVERLVAKPVDRCEAIDLEGVWDDERRAEVERGLARLPAAYAASTTRAVLERLDTYAAALGESQLAACRASQTSDEALEVAADRTMTCLRRRKHDLGALVDLLANSDATVGEHAIDAVAELPSIAACDDAPSYAAAIEPARRVEIEAADDLLSRVKAAVLAGRYLQARSQMDVLLDRTRALDHPPLTAETHYVHAELLQRLSEHERAEEAYLRAIDAAAITRDDRLTAQAFSGLLFTAGHSLAEYERAEGYARHLEAVVQRLGSPPDLEAELVATLGLIEHDKGRFAEARALLEHAITLRQGGDLERSPAPDLVHLGRTMAAQGELVAARDTVARAVSVLEKKYGPSHPQVAKGLVHLGALAFDAGELASAKEHFERALQMQIDTLGPRHAEVALSTSNVGNVLMMEGELEAARDHYGRARELILARFGEDHPHFARLTFNLAELQKMMGHLDESEVEYERAVHLFERALGPDHLDVGRALNNLASVQYDAERYEASLTSYAEALRIVEAALGPENHHLGYPLTGLGLVYIMLDRPLDAIAPLERSLRLRATDDVDPVDRADTQLALARAFTAAKLEPARTRALLEHALGGYDQAAAGVKTNRAEAEALYAAIKRDAPS